MQAVLLEDPAIKTGAIEGAGDGEPNALIAGFTMMRQAIPMLQQSGVTLDAQTVGLPVVVSFTLETDPSTIVRGREKALLAANSPHVDVRVVFGAGHMIHDAIDTRRLPGQRRFQRSSQTNLRRRARLAGMRIFIVGTDLPSRTFCAPDGASLDYVHVGVQIRTEPEHLVRGDATDARHREHKPSNPSFRLRLDETRINPMPLRRRPSQQRVVVDEGVIGCGRLLWQRSRTR